MTRSFDSKNAFSLVRLSRFINDALVASLVPEVFQTEVLSSRNVQLPLEVMLSVTTVPPGYSHGNREEQRLHFLR